MTNYNERIDEILERHGMYAVLKDENRFDDAAMEREFPDEVGPDKTKQAIASLIKELVAEAKPEIKAHPLGPVTLADCQRGLDQFEQNLLKALEE